jgi:hypothetical protein
MSSPEIIKKFWRRITRKKSVSQEIRQITGTVHIVNMDTNTEREIRLGPSELPGWNDLVKGWSIGEMSSGSDIEIDEPLTGVHLGIYPASHHIMLWGRVDEGCPLPQTAALVGSEWRGQPTIREQILDFQIDHRPFRIGSHMLRASWDWQKTQAS